MEGAFYTKEFKLMNEENRVGLFPYDDSLPVNTHWDIGVKDRTVILFSQVGKDGYLNIIDMIHDNNKGLQSYIKMIKDKDYMWGTHYAPHDMFRVQFAGEIEGETRAETAGRLGLHLDRTPDTRVELGIEAVRRVFSKIRINKGPCDRLLEAIPSYRRIYNETTQRYNDKPYHDWTSDYTDALRYLSIVFDQGLLISGGSPEGWGSPIQYNNLGIR